MPLPIPNLDDLTFQELYENARRLIPRYAPDWTDHNLSDPGLTFIDLFSWLAEMQVYYLNRVPDANYGKFFKLLGESLSPATPARVQLNFDLLDAGSQDASILRKGFQTAANHPDTGARIYFELDEKLMLIPNNLIKILGWFEKGWMDHTESNARDNTFYFPFGDQPKSGDCFYLGFDASSKLPKGEITLTINALDAPGSKAEAGPAMICPSAELEWSYWDGSTWTPLQIIEDETISLTRSGRLVIQSPGDSIIEKATIQDVISESRMTTAMELYWIRSRIKTSGYELPPRLDTILINSANATHSRTMAAEQARGTGLPFQTIRLKHSPVLANSVIIKVFEKDSKWHRWHEVNDLTISGPESRHFKVDLQNGAVLFGDGITGQIPPETDQGYNIRIVKYKIGSGLDGNVAAGKITKVVDSSWNGKISVSNRKPATGGAPPESMDEAKRRMRRDMKKITRCVTVSDFETLVCQTPGVHIARAAVLPQYHPDFPAASIPGAVTVVVLPETLQNAISPPSPGFLNTVKKHLQEKSLIATNLYVVAPEFVQITVRARIKMEPHVRTEIVQRAVGEALKQFLDPFAGGPDGHGWPFGRAVYKSEICQVIENVPHVSCVEMVSIKGDSCDPKSTDKITLRRIGLVYSGEHEVLIK